MGRHVIRQGYFGWPLYGYLESIETAENVRNLVVKAGLNEQAGILGAIALVALE